MAYDNCIFPAEIRQFFIYKADTFINLADMQTDNFQLITLNANEFIAMDTVKNVLAGCPGPVIYQLQDLIIAD